MAKKGCPVKRCGFVVHSQITVDEVRVLLEKLGDVVSFLSFDVPEKVFVRCKSASDALYCSHL